MWKNALDFARKYIWLTSFQHFCAGFGLAILAQNYVQGFAFAPLSIGWSLVLFSIAIHIIEFAVPALSKKAIKDSPYPKY